MRADTARALVDAVITAFDKGEGRLLEWYPAQEGDRESCYLFSYFATTGMLYQAIRAGEERHPLFRELIDALVYYRSAASSDGMAKYHSERGAAPGTGEGPVFFDDNIWVARNLLWAHEVLGDSKYLAEAERVAAFVYSAWDDELGGVSWNEAGLGPDGTEQELERGLSANACSILVSATLHRLTGRADYLTWAHRFRDFCVMTLDAETGIYFNGVHTRIVDGRRVRGEVNRDLYAYNSGSMILADLALFDLTGDRALIDDAVRTAAAAHDAFLRVDEAGGARSYKDFIWFLAILAEGYLELLERDLVDSEVFDVFRESIAGGIRFRSETGFLPHDHAAGWRTGDDAIYDRMLLTHSGTAEIAELLVLADQVHPAAV